MIASSKNGQTEAAVSCCPLKYLLDVFLVGFLEHCIHEQVLKSKQKKRQIKPFRKTSLLNNIKA